MNENKNGEHFFAMLSRMKHINRWGLMRNTKTENISEHSLDVAIISHALAVIRNQRFEGTVNPERAAILGIFHDATEIITGDLPTPVKYYNPAIRKAYAQVEKTAKNKLLSMLPSDMQNIYEPLLSHTDQESEAWKIVKAADKISALIKCIEEKSMGNAEFNKAEIALRNTIDNMNLKEADCFLAEFIPSYRLTLDEQE